MYIKNLNFKLFQFENATFSNVMVVLVLDVNLNFLLSEMQLDKLKKKQVRIAKQGAVSTDDESSSDDNDDEQDMEFEGGFKVPGKIWKKLYR